jgi:hypothetical protein
METFATVPLSELKNGDWVTQCGQSKPVYVVQIDAETGEITLYDHGHGDHLIENMDPTADVLVDRLTDEIVAKAKRISGRDTPS